MEVRIREKMYTRAPKEYPASSPLDTQALVHKLEYLWNGCSSIAPESSRLSINQLDAKELDISMRKRHNFCIISMGFFQTLKSETPKKVAKNGVFCEEYS